MRAVVSRDACAVDVSMGACGSSVGPKVRGESGSHQTTPGIHPGVIAIKAFRCTQQPCFGVLPGDHSGTPGPGYEPSPTPRQPTPTPTPASYPHTAGNTHAPERSLTLTESAPAQRDNPKVSFPNRATPDRSNTLATLGRSPPLRPPKPMTSAIDSVPDALMCCPLSSFTTPPCCQCGASSAVGFSAVRSQLLQFNRSCFGSVQLQLLQLLLLQLLLLQFSQRCFRLDQSAPVDKTNPPESQSISKVETLRHSQGREPTTTQPLRRTRHIAPSRQPI